ncbi:MAG: FkbM family methyltransferase [Candidatus Nitrosopolaris sp.]
MDYHGTMDPLNIPVYPNEIISLNKYKKYFEDVLVFDIGAFKGIWSLTALKSGAKYVIAFEPEPIEDSCVNLSEYAGKYRCINAFVTDEEHLQKDDNFRITIDNFVAKQCNLKHNEVMQLGFIKIDVEGDEMEVLRGAEKTIKRLKPRMMIESHDYKFPGRKEEIQMLLDSWGFGAPRDITDHTVGLSEIYHIFYMN